MMSKKGLAKLVEELCELGQAACKKMARMWDDHHWDGTVSMKDRLELEMGDVFGACRLVVENFDLDLERIMRQADSKYRLFKKWDEAPNDYEGDSMHLIEDEDVRIMKGVVEDLANNHPDGLSRDDTEKLTRKIANLMQRLKTQPIGHEEHGGTEDVIIGRSLRHMMTED